MEGSQPDFFRSIVTSAGQARHEDWFCAVAIVMSKACKLCLFQCGLSEFYRVASVGHGMRPSVLPWYFMDAYGQDGFGVSCRCGLFFVGGLASGHPVFSQLDPGAGSSVECKAPQEPGARGLEYTLRNHHDRIVTTPDDDVFPARCGGISQA